MADHAGRLIIALDLPDPAQAERLAEKLAPLGVSFKVGLELFMAGGPYLAAKLASRYRVFLDLKFHDIPNTAAAAVKAAAALGVWMLNIHAAGGRDMMLAAKEAVEASGKKPLLLAVTVLTSMNDNLMAETGCEAAVAERVAILARLAEQCGLDGVICSPLEISTVRKAASSRFLTVTPGVRTLQGTADDQARVAAPAEVIRAGGDYLVVGRPVTRAADPIEAARTILNEMGEAI